MINSPHFKSVFISDTHLGNKDCKAEFLLHFLNSVTFDKLYLVGDIVDMWAMSKQFRWPQAHNAVLHKIVELSHNKSKQIIYLPGNHDEPLQKYSGLNFGRIEIHREYVHTTALGKKYLVLHGDQFDPEVRLGKFHAWIGDKGYDLLLFLNRELNRVRRWYKKDYWSLSGYLKKRVKGANEAIERFKNASTKRAKALGLDGVICGHIHNPEADVKNDVEYINDGDWIENCTALVEDHNGQMQILDWLEFTKRATVSKLNSGKIKGSKAA